MNRISRLARGLAGVALVTTPALQLVAQDTARLKPRVVDVTAYDYHFKSPASVPAGTLTFRMKNAGSEVHHLWVVRLDRGRTPAEFLKVMNAWGSALKMPDWATDVGGPNNVGAGQTASGTMTLEPGTYMLVCWVPSPDGRPHVMKGMVKPLTVTPQGQTVAAEPTADVTMTLDDYSFTLSGPLTAGTRTIRFENKATQPHEAVIARLLPERTMLQAIVWMNSGQSGPAPVAMLGGASGIAQGRHMFVTADLKPGKYVLLCFIPDARDGRPHSAHGMAKEITVEP
ncbi:MAG TPA: hypothetical protein VGP95_03865 [Gemmatimonadaceae bacterium]|jgi:uncharacterized cupredoxin-like copper-binding protein|nr:hypothetical protein [Gemmatimonadaceae bacterium]